MIAFLADFLKIENHDVFGTYVDAKAAALAKTLIHNHPCHEPILSLWLNERRNHLLPF
jgi:hypothetical protein